MMHHKEHRPYALKKKVLRPEVGKGKNIKTFTF